MHKDIRFQAIFRGMKHPAYILFCFGCIGLILGTLFAAYADPSIFPVMCRAVFEPVSIVLSGAAQLLPFLIAAYAASISRLRLINIVCGCKLFLFAYTGSLIWSAFSAAGWLIRSLLLFSDVILVPCLCWYCFRLVMGDWDERKDFGICLGILVITALLNCLFISPFLVKIM